jgi:ribonucleoside-triphosphate reductase
MPVPAPAVLPSTLQQFQHVSKYSRYREELGRREVWPETMDRYFGFFRDRSPDAFASGRWDELKWAFSNLEAIGSMRALWSAGQAAAKDEVAIYNCAYLTISRVEAFDEIMYLLMCGVGVGFSVREKYISKLPVVPREFVDHSGTYKVRDSKYGWADALRFVIKSLYAGELPRWDLSGVRANGVPLKTFGGRASGPEPLDKLLRHTVKTFLGARGRKLTSVECHSIACMILDIVHVGGVRRAAGIDLFDVDDRAMMNSKIGEYPVHFGLTNNSGVFEGRPPAEHFFDYFGTMVRSYGGEPGFYNLTAAQERAAEWSRRSPDFEYGINPCGEIILRDRGLCNLSAGVARPADTLDDLKRKYGYAVDLGTLQTTMTNFKHLSPQWQRNAEEERLLGASLDGIPDHPVLNGSEGRDTLKRWLNELRDHGRRVAEGTAGRMQINVPAAIGALKPAGNSSVLHGAAPPLKAWHGKFYIRRTRINKNDPLYHFLQWHEFPIEDEVGHEDTTAVISWPVKAPDGAKTRHDWSALDQLELWLLYRDEFCEHNASVTINVKDEEWVDAAAFLWKHFDKAVGVTFLPHDGGHYVQAPYEECTEGEYYDLLDKVPTELDWTILGVFESGDQTTGARELACVSGACELPQ